MLVGALIGSVPGVGGERALGDEGSNVVDLRFWQSRMPTPREIPRPVRRLVNQRRVLALLDESLAAVGEDREPVVKVLLGQRGSGKSTVAVHWVGAGLIDVAPLERDGAVELLRDFADDRVDAEPEALAGILARCGGLPIALCQVGYVLAEDPGLSLADLLEEVSDPASGMTQMSLGDLPSLASIFGASYRRLNDVEQRCYRALGLAPDGGRLPVAALASALNVPKSQGRRVVRELVVKRIIDEPETGRLEVHNLIREHARHLTEAIDSDDERRVMRTSILRWYETTSIAADNGLNPSRGWWPRLFPDVSIGSSPARPDEWFDNERGNLRWAVSSAYELGLHDVVEHLCVALWSFYEQFKHYDDLLATHELGLKVTGNELVRALLLVRTSFALRYRGDYDEALTRCRAAAAIAAQAKSPELEATAIEAAGLAEVDRGNLGEAVRLLRRNLELAELIGDVRRTALARMHLAKAEELDVALALLRDAFDAFQQLGEGRNAGKVRTSQGRRLRERGDLAEADGLLAEAADLLARWPYDLAQVLDERGAIAAGQGDPAAQAFYEQALEIYESGGHVTAAAATRAMLLSLPS
ncbi:hypothetical protein GCM10029964_030930 [Kibdelosporangium lantanae]